MRRLFLTLLLVSAPALATDAGPAADAGLPPPVPAPPVPAPRPEPEPEPPPPADAGADLDISEETEPPVEGEAKARKRLAVRYHDAESPLVLTLPYADRTVEERRKEIERAFAASLDLASDEDRVPKVSIRVEDGLAHVRLDEVTIATLTPEDAAAEGQPLEAWSKSLEAPLQVFIDEALQKASLAQLFLHIFFSVFGLVLGFFTLRLLSRFFDRLDETLDEKRGRMKPIELFRVPVFSGDTVGGALALAGSIGRVVTYIACVLATFAFVFSQFDFTRPLVGRLGRWSAGPILSGLEKLVTAIPGVILALILLVALRAALRVLHLLLDGVQSKRIQWKRLPPERVSPFRVVSTAAAVLITTPLIVAAVFGGFGSPVEILALGAGGVVLVATLPVLASYAVGITILWRGMVRPGDWVQVGEFEGEVTALAFHEIRLVPEGGGVIDLPALYLLTHPIKRLRGSPEISFDMTVARDRPARELLEAMRAAIVAVEDDAKAEIVDICHAWVKIRVFAPAVRDRAREALLIAISDAADRHEFELPVLHAELRAPERAEAEVEAAD